MCITLYSYRLIFVDGMSAIEDNDRPLIYMYIYMYICIINIYVYIFVL